MDANSLDYAVLLSSGAFEEVRGATEVSFMGGGVSFFRGQQLIVAYACGYWRTVVPLDEG